MATNEEDKVYDIDDGKKKPKSKYKINFYQALKWEINELKCGNCGDTSKEMYQCKYSIKEYDEFSKKVITKNKTTKVCGKCKWYIQSVVFKAKQDPKKIAEAKVKYNIKENHNDPKEMALKDLPKKAIGIVIVKGTLEKSKVIETTQGWMEINTITDGEGNNVDIKTFHEGDVKEKAKGITLTTEGKYIIDTYSKRGTIWGKATIVKQKDNQDVEEAS